MAIKRDTGAAVGTVQPAKPVDMSELFVKRTPQNRKTRSVITIGAVGVGKTSSFATIPKEIIDPDTGELVPARVLHIDTDDKGNVLDTDTVPHFDFLRIPYDPINHMDTFNTLTALVDNLNRKVPPFNEYNVGILDGLTPIDYMLWRLSFLPPPFGVGTSRIKNDKDWTEFEISEYDTNYTQGADKNYEWHKEKMGMLLFSLKNRFKYFFVTAHIKEPFPLAKKKLFSPKVHGGTKELIPELFHEVYYCLQKGSDTSGRPNFMWLTRTQGEYVARTCLPIKQFVPMDYSIITNGNWEQYRDDDPKEKAEATNQPIQEAEE